MQSHFPEPVTAQRTQPRGSNVSVMRSVTPVYSSVNPPRGLSGALRTMAYGIPEYEPRRWMLLLLADRVDVAEHNLPRLLLLAGGGALVYWLLTRNRSHRPAELRSRRRAPRAPSFAVAR